MFNMLLKLGPMTRPLDRLSLFESHLLLLGRRIVLDPLHLVDMLTPASQLHDIYLYLESQFAPPWPFG